MFYLSTLSRRNNIAALGFPRSPRVEQIFSAAREHTERAAPKPIPSNPKILAWPQKYCPASIASGSLGKIISRGRSLFDDALSGSHGIFLWAFIRLPTHLMFLIMNNSQKVLRVSHITKPYLITTVAAFLTLFLGVSAQGELLNVTTLDVP